MSTSSVIPSWYQSAVATEIAWYFTVVGGTLTVLGLIIAYLQLRKISTASKAATTAINGLKLKFSHFEVIEECGNAEQALKLLKSDDAKDLVAFDRNCDRLAKSLINISERWDADEGMQASIDRSVRTVSSLFRSKNSDEFWDPTLTKKRNMALLDVYRLLVKIRTKISQVQ